MGSNISRGKRPWHACEFRERESDGQIFLVPVEPFHTTQPLPRATWERLVTELKRSLSHFSDADIEESIRQIEAQRTQEKLAYEREEQERIAQQRCYRASKGYVYIMQGDNYFKIGSSTNLARRIKTLNCKSPFQVCVRLLLPSEDIDCLERELHAAYRHKRQRGEWFLLTEEDLESIRSAYTTIDPIPLRAD